MTHEHVIETLEWDVGFRSEEEAFDWQPRLARLVRGPAVDAIASVFDELSADGVVLVLDSLTLDLGRLAPADFEACAAERLREKLREALLQELGGRHTGAPGAVQAVTRQANDAEALKHYLARGYLPWSTGSRTANRLDELAGRAARESGESLAQWLDAAPPQAAQRLSRLLAGDIARARAVLEAALVSDGALDARVQPAWAQLLRWDADWLLAHLRQRGQAAQVRQRMARGFTQEMLLDLVGLVVPTERDFIAQVVDEGAVFQRAQQPATPPGALRPRLWEFTLTYLLVERGSDFNRRSYMGSILRQAARHEGMDYGQLLRAMSAALREVAAPTGLQRQMLQLLGELSREEDSRAPARAEEEQASLQLIAQYDRYGQADDRAARDALAGFRSLLQAALLADTAPTGALHHAWRELVRWDAPWLVEQARQHGQDAQVRERMARGFAQEMLLELTELLVPGERGFVQEVIGEATLFARARAQARDGAAAPDELRPRLWEFTLAYLLVERGSEFNRRSYMGSLLRRMARHDGLEYGVLLQSMMQALRETAAPTSLQRQMLRMLEGLAPARDEAAPGRGPAPGSALWNQRELPGLRFRWQAALATGDLRGAEVALAWRQLARHDTGWLLQETLRCAQAGPLRRQMARELPEEALLELVALLAPGESGFVEAALAQSARLHRRDAALAGDAHGVRAQLWEFTLTYLVVERGSEFNRRSYIGSLLRQMAGREGLELRELLGTLVASLRALGTASELQRQMLRLATELLAGCGAQDAAQPQRSLQLSRLTRALQHTGSVPSAQAAQLVQDANDLLAHGDAAVRAALEDALRSPQAAARLAALLPARLLTRVVWLLRREHHHALQRGADLIVDAVVAAGTQVPRARLQSLMWQYVLRYLFVEGREFSLADFARRFTDWLAVQLRVAQPAQWRASVAAQAARDKRSAVQAVGRAVAAALVAAAPPPPKPQPRPPAVKRPVTADEPAQGEPIYVAGAGLVICEPYLPRLFAMLDLVEGAAFRDAACAGKAVRLMQFAATGKQEAPEHLLVLNKLMCGLPPDAPVDCETPLGEADQATVEGMLKGILAHWKALGGTTVEGLRETFLQRQGRLVRQDEHWHLLVEPGPYDMLLDQLPWGFSMIKYPWMERMLHVQWR